MATYYAVGNKATGDGKALQRDLGQSWESEAKRLALAAYLGKPNVVTIAIMRHDVNGISRCAYDRTSSVWGEWS